MRYLIDSQISVGPANIVACYRAHDRSLRAERERFRRFTHDEILARNNINLDITWLPTTPTATTRPARPCSSPRSWGSSLGPPHRQARPLTSSGQRAN